jgi:hypothetical protein
LGKCYPFAAGRLSTSGLSRVFCIESRASLSHWLFRRGTVSLVDATHAARRVHKRRKCLRLCTVRLAFVLQEYRARISADVRGVRNRRKRLCEHRSVSRRSRQTSPPTAVPQRASANRPESSAAPCFKFPLKHGAHSSMTRFQPRSLSYALPLLVAVLIGHGRQIFAAEIAGADRRQGYGAVEAGQDSRLRG